MEEGHQVPAVASFSLFSTHDWYVFHAISKLSGDNRPGTPSRSNLESSVKGGTSCSRRAGEACRDLCCCWCCCCLAGTTNGDDDEGRGAAWDSLAAHALPGIRNLGLNMVVACVSRPAAPLTKNSVARSVN